MLETLKLILEIGDTSQDVLLNFYISKATKAIQSYCLLDSLPSLDLDEAVISLAAVYYQKRGSNAVSYQMEGARAANLIDGIPQDIKDLLSSYRKVRSI
ncbi:head-tail connector protein [Sporolactobacillus laevolacticus]|uniref:head-tail connector protein n=1 Tax=Sporolactobacillus laevolacticus TaxID=33018 RepID=UPI0025B513B4|nr:head-tail connector protein [Sporolactobacillus laevolacticus]MDN3956189.1 head-tail connector protein [Sporolactobacillus laevolacticus]